MNQDKMNELLSFVRNSLEDTTNDFSIKFEGGLQTIDSPKNSCLEYERTPELTITIKARQNEVS